VPVNLPAPRIHRIRDIESSTFNERGLSVLAPEGRGMVALQRCFAKMPWEFVDDSVGEYLDFSGKNGSRQNPAL
jgi:hypothetical protein